MSRLLGPLGLVLKGGVWYLVATSSDQIRTYRVSRVVGATVLDERPDRPAGFELATYWAESSAAYERESPRIKVVVRLPENRLERLATAVGWQAVDAAERLDDPEPGWLRMRLDLGWPDEVSGHMLSVGSSLEVLEPTDIRERVISTARRILDRYGRDGRDEPIEAPVDGAQALTADANPAAPPAATDASVTGR